MSNKKQGAKAGGGGFLSFVNSIITDKVKLAKGSDKHQQEGSQHQATTQAHEEQGTLNNDLALIQQIQEANKSGSSKDRPSSVLLRGSIGLGYEATKAELEANTQIQRLKNQIKKTEEQDIAEKKVSKSQHDHEHTAKGHQVQSKRNSQGGDLKAQMINDKQEKKRLKKQRQKEKKDGEITQVAAVQEEQQEVVHVPKEQKGAEQQSRDERNERGLRLRPHKEGKMDRVRTKTRSRQKNKRRDNRPEEVKRAKLAERGIVI